MNGPGSAILAERERLECRIKALELENARLKARVEELEDLDCCTCFDYGDECPWCERQPPEEP